MFLCLEYPQSICFVVHQMLKFGGIKIKPVGAVLEVTNKSEN